VRRWQVWKAWRLVIFAALASVVAFASPAAAAVPSTTSVTATPAAATVGQTVQLTATVTCSADPSGGLGVTFFDGPDLLATAPVNASGQATLPTTFSTTGSHTITAAYNGNADCFASNSTTTVQVSEAPPVPPTTPCLLCGSLIGFTVGNIHNEVN